MHLRELYGNATALRCRYHVNDHGSCNSTVIFLSILIGILHSNGDVLRGQRRQRERRVWTTTRGKGFRQALKRSTNASKFLIL